MIKTSPQKKIISLKRKPLVLLIFSSISFLLILFRLIFLQLLNYESFKKMSDDQISPNRNRFYPEIDWADLSHEQKLIKDGTVEMFLKTLELISTFHPYLSSGQLLEVERKMAIIKKIPFEKWVIKSFAKKARLLENEKRKFQRERFISSWREWFSLVNTQQAILPLIVTIFISSFIGWSLGISKNSCNPYFEQNIEQLK